MLAKTDANRISGDTLFEIQLRAQYFFVLDQPWIIAGKRADPIQGSNVFLAACQ
jgi:hypothetical protein